MFKKDLQSLVEFFFSVFIGFVVVFTVTAGLSLVIPLESFSHSGEWTASDQAYEEGRRMLRAVIALVIAVGLMLSSLKVPENFRVLGDGAFFGGIFTTFYSLFTVSGTGDDREVERFLITVFALVAVAFIGWLKFSKNSKSGAAKTSTAPTSAELSDVEARLSRIETTLKHLSDAFKKE